MFPAPEPINTVAIVVTSGNPAATQARLLATRRNSDSPNVAGYPIPAIATTLRWAIAASPRKQLDVTEVTA